jgi:hypothetical protein
MSAILDPAARLDAQRAEDLDRTDALTGTLNAKLANEISSLRKAWMFVGSAFQKPSPHCEECGYCEHKGQMLPYGEGQAYEAYQECSLGQRASDKPQMCPAYAEFLSEQAESATSPNEGGKG